MASNSYAVMPALRKVMYLIGLLWLPPRVSGGCGKLLPPRLSMRRHRTGRADVHSSAWNTGETLTVNVASLVSRFALYAPLKKATVFCLAKADEWGHAVVWPDGIDMGADQLYSLCREQSGEWGPEQFSVWMERNHLSLSEAADALGMTRRMMAHYKTGSRPIPKVVRLACEGWEHRHVA